MRMPVCSLSHIHLVKDDILGKQQWEKMKIGSNNDALKNISIHYESPEKDTV